MPVMRRLTVWILLVVLTALVPAEAMAAPDAGVGGGQVGFGLWFSMGRRSFSETFLAAYRGATSTEVALYRETCVSKSRQRKGRRKGGKVFRMRCSTTDLLESVPNGAFEIDPLLEGARLGADLSAGRVDLVWIGAGEYPTTGTQAIAHPQYGLLADVSAYRDATASGSVLGGSVDTGPIPEGGEVVLVDGDSVGFAFLLEGAGAGAFLDTAPGRFRAMVGGLTG